MGRAKRLGLVLKVVLCLCFTGTLGCVASIWHCWKCRWWSVMASFHQYSRLLMPLEKGSPISFTAVSTLRYLPGAVIAALLGLLVDFPMVTFIALCKSPYMLFKGWHRLFHDLIGGEGPLLETMFVPFAGLTIIFRPLAVDGVLLGSMASSIFLGAYAGLIVYQESSFWFGLCYVVASLAIYDEYCNDVPDMPEASCFPRFCSPCKFLCLNGLMQLDTVCLNEFFFLSNSYSQYLICFLFLPFNFTPIIYCYYYLYSHYICCGWRGFCEQLSSLPQLLYEFCLNKLQLFMSSLWLRW